MLGLIKHAWLESGEAYGYRKIYDNLCDPIPGIRAGKWQDREIHAGRHDGYARQARLPHQPCFALERCWGPTADCYLASTRLLDPVTHISIATRSSIRSHAMVFHQL